MSNHRIAARRGTDLAGHREALRVWLLGGFRASVGARVVGGDAWRLRKAAGVVKLLALARDHRLHRERLMASLWPDLDARSASNNLHRALYVARRTLAPASGANYLRFEGDLLVLSPDGPLWVDVDGFEEAAATARVGRDPAAYRAALALYAGDLLPEDLYEESMQERRQELRRLHLALLLELAAAHEKRGEYEPAVEALLWAATEDPVREETHAGLMRLYALLGRRTEAARQYERLREALSRELGAEPGPSSRRLFEEIREGQYPTAPPPSPSGGREPAGRAFDNLPIPLTSFVGREGEMLEAGRQLAMTRLLTFTGAGGCGKTRLALELGGRLVGAYPDGVWLVELAPLSDPTLVLREVAAVLGVKERPDRPLAQAIADRVGSGRALMILDNCEHLVEAAARTAKDLLSICPRLRVLATSREALGISGETVLPVPTLSLPDPGAEVTVEALIGSEAVQLFVQRARSRLPTFGLTRENAGAVARICRELDGVPLAIELSTARMGSLAVEQVAERLAGSLGLLVGGDRTVPPRQQTLRATLDWSHALLSEPERTLFARLSVFAGGWTLEAAEAVGAGDGIERDDVSGLLSRLVDKSMVIVEMVEDGGLRYAMLEPVRHYGRESLGASKEAAAIRRRHARWHFGLAQEVEPWSRGSRHEAWLERLETEYGNLRAALAWALESGEVDLGLWFGGALAEFWYMSGNLSEARRWLEAALANGGGSRPTPARTRALVRAGWIAWEQGDYGASKTLSETSLALARDLGDKAGVVAALSNLGWVALLENDLQQALALGEDAAALGRDLEDAGGVARALLIPGLAAVAVGDHERALALYEEGLALARRARDDLAVVLSLVMGTLARLGKGDVRRAGSLCEEGLALSPRPRVMNVTAFQLSASAALVAARGRPAHSARLWGAAAALRETIGARISPVELQVYGPYVETARARLDEAAWEESAAEGAAMSVEEAVDYALSDGAEEPPSRTRRRPVPEEPSALKQRDGSLTRRQQEVALLVARGLTNRQISYALHISQNTVANHVAGAIRKLKVTSRSGIAAWTAERRLRETE